MSDALETAAQAFDSAMGRSTAPAPRAQGEVARQPEPVFENMGELIDDEEAGGDELPVPKAKKPVQEDVDTSELSPEELEAFLAQEQEEDEEVDPKAKDDEDDEDEDELLSREFEVLVDGQETKVTLREALDGYIRQDTFHRRLNAVNDATKVVQAEASKVIQARQKYATMLDEAQQTLESLIPKEPDWDALYAEDPVKARGLQKQYDAYKGQIETIKQKRTAAEQQAAAEDAAEQKEFAQKEFPKFAKNAGWRTKEDMLKDTSSMRRTGLALGFSEEELASVYDSRMLTILLKASKYDRMMAARPKAVKNSKTPVSPGAGRNRTAPKGIAKAQANLNRTGSVEDAATVFANIIKR